MGHRSHTAHLLVVRTRVPAVLIRARARVAWSGSDCQGGLSAPQTISARHTRRGRSTRGSGTDARLCTCQAVHVRCCRVAVASNPHSMWDGVRGQRHPESMRTLLYCTAWPTPACSLSLPIPLRVPPQARTGAQGPTAGGGLICPTASEPRRPIGALLSPRPRMNTPPLAAWVVRTGCSNMFGSNTRLERNANFSVQKLVTDRTPCIPSSSRSCFLYAVVENELHRTVSQRRREWMAMPATPLSIRIESTQFRTSC